MKRAILLLVILALLIPTVVLAEVGPYLDKIYFDVRTQEDIGIQDTATGKTDVFMYGLDGVHVMGLSQDTLSKLDMYSVPSGSWSFMFNPIPNKAPYTWDVDGETIFNPLAIREVRFALNWLMDRQYIVDEILMGAGGPMYTIATPGQPGTYRYNLVASRLGYSPEGDEEMALKNIEEAMQAAADLPENKGKLVKENGWWMYNGKKVTLKFAIRVDDPQGRMREGAYVANQIRKAGIEVDELLWDRVKCIEEAYYSNPADYTWSIYTEGWGAGGTRKYWDNIVSQMYAPWYGYQAGGANPDNWNYENDEMDRITQKAYSGNFATGEEYWNLVLGGTELGLTESTRIYVAYQNQYFVTNKERVSRLLYGTGDGLNEWSLMSANTPDGELRVTQFSAKGGLFMSAWDPVGNDGFSDTYSNNIAAILYDPGMVNSPTTAAGVVLRTKPIDWNVNNVGFDENNELVGTLTVPDEAIDWDPIEEKWVSVGGKQVMSTATYEMIGSNNHHGQPMSITDYMYARAFVNEWSTEDFPGDPYYEATYESANSANFMRGYIYDVDNGTVTTYYDYNFPPEEWRAVTMGAPSWGPSQSGQRVNVTWEVNEALARLVADGGHGDIVWSFSPTKEGTEQVDILSPVLMEDLVLELEEMIAERHVPKSIAKYVSADTAVERYQAVIDFVEKYNHAYISNGAFFLSDFDTNLNYAELSAFRDETYPYTSEHWVDFYRTERLVIDNIDVPIMKAKGEDIPVKIDVSKSIYPLDQSSPAQEGVVSVVLIDGEKEHTFEARMLKPGLYVGTIPAEITETLEAGTYTVLGMAQLGDSVPANKSGMVIIY